MTNEHPNRLREILARHAHDEWSSYVLYLLSKLHEQPDGSLTIPTGYAAALRRQATTAYETLIDSEQELDREQADKLIALLRQHNIL